MRLIPSRKWTRSGIATHPPRVLQLALTIDPFSVEQAEFAAQLWGKGRHYGLSLADRACLALAMQRGTIVLTADRVWFELSLNIEIQLIR